MNQSQYNRAFTVSMGLTQKQRRSYYRFDKLYRYRLMPFKSYWRLRRFRLWQYAKERLHRLFEEELSKPSYLLSKLNKEHSWKGAYIVPFGSSK